MKKNEMMKSNIISLLGILSVIFLIFIILFVSLMILSHLGVVQLPQSMRNLFSFGSPDDRIFGDEGRLYEVLSGKKTNEEVTLAYSISSDLFRSVLAGVEMPDEYYAENRVRYIGEGQTLQKRYQIYVSGSRYRIMEYSGDEIEMSYICDGVHVYIVRADGEMRQTAISDVFSPDRLAAITPLSALESDTISHITKASSVDSSLYSVEFVPDEHGKREILYVSPAYGMVLRAETYMGDTQSFQSVITDWQTNLDALGLPDRFFEYDGS